MAAIRERLSMNKQRSLIFHVKGFNLKTLNEVDSKEKYRFEFSNRFTVLEDLDAKVDINSAWKTIRENIKMAPKEILCYYELKKHKPWFEEGCSELLDQWKRAKLQWLQDPSEINGDNLNNVRREAGRHFLNKKREYLKDKINEIAKNSKNKSVRELYRGINELKRGYQPRSDLSKDENSDLRCRFPQYFK
jgi:hypothetical protein